MNAEDIPEIAKIVALIEDDARYRVDMSLIDELIDTARDGRRWKDMTAAQYKTRADLQVVAKRLDESLWLRCRVREIKFKHAWLLSALNRLWDACCTVLYRDDEYRKMSPAPARDAKINAALPRIRERLDNVKLLCKMADETDDLMSGAYFTMRELVRINTAYLDAEARE